MLLSICVPTYNRLKWLKELVNSICEQNFDYNQIEVCISDNFSSDGTGEYLANLTQSYPWIRFNINEYNCGLDMNMIKTMQMAKGKYILPIGDDDCFIKGSIEEIAKNIKNEPDLLILNGWLTDSNLLPKHEYMPEHLKNASFSSPLKAFSELWNQMRFGSFVVNTSILNLNNYQKYLGTSHAYTGIVWDALAEKYQKTKHCEVNCMRLPTILFRMGEKSWTETKFAILVDEIPEWFNRLPTFYNDTKNPIRLNYMRLQTKFSYLLYYRASGILTTHNINQFMSRYSKFDQKKALMISVIPIRVAQITYFLGKVIREKLWINR